MALAYSGPTTMYEIANPKHPDVKRTHYSNVLRSMKQLRKRDFVKLVRREKGKKGHTKHLYDLTPVGELVVVAIIENLDFNSFAKRPGGWLNQKPPLSHWSTFESKKITRVPKIMVRESARRFLLEITKGADVRSFAVLVDISDESVMRQSTKEERDRWKVGTAVSEELAQTTNHDLEAQRDYHLSKASLLDQALRTFNAMRSFFRSQREKGMTEEQIEKNLLRVMSEDMLLQELSELLEGTGESSRYKDHGGD